MNTSPANRNAAAPIAPTASAALPPVGAACTDFEHHQSALSEALVWKRQRPRRAVYGRLPGQVSGPGQAGVRLGKGFVTQSRLW